MFLATTAILPRFHSGKEQYKIYHKCPKGLSSCLYGYLARMRHISPAMKHLALIMLLLKKESNAV